MICHIMPYYMLYYVDESKCKLCITRLASQKKTIANHLVTCPPQSSLYLVMRSLEQCLVPDEIALPISPILISAFPPRYQTVAIRIDMIGRLLNT